MARKAKRKGKGTVRSHTRGPRGADRGKKRVKVRAYSRGKPDPGSYPRYPKNKRVRRRP